MNRNLQRALLVNCLFLSLLLVPSSLSAQRDTASLKGVVTDPHGAVVPGALVTAKRRPAPDNEQVRTATSNTEGRFEIGQLAPGRYEVSSESSGMIYSNDNVNIQPGMAVELTLTLTFEAHCSQETGKGKLAVSDKDKAEIINQILVDSLTKNKVPDFELLTKQEGPIIISTKNISSEWIKPVPSFEFRFLKEDAIQAKADSGKDFLYLSFHDWRVGADCVVLTLSNGWAVGKNSGYGYLSGGGWIYKFQRVSGKWIGGTVGGWIS